MDKPLAGKKVLILIASGFEETELTEAQRALIKAGATLKTASVDSGLVNGWHGKGWGHYYTIDSPINDVLASDFDCLLLPGGERSINKLKQSAHTRRIINNFLDGAKPLAAIGRALDLLVLAGPRLSGCHLSGPPDIAELLASSEAVWCPEPVTRDKNLVTAQSSPETMSVFVTTMIAAFGENPGNISAAA